MEKQDFYRFGEVLQDLRPNGERRSKSASSSNFALNELIERSVRAKNLRFGLELVFYSTLVNSTLVP